MQAATESDISQRKKGDNAEKEVPVKDLEYSSGPLEDSDTEKERETECFHTSPERPCLNGKSPEESNPAFASYESPAFKEAPKIRAESEAQYESLDTAAPGDVTIEELKDDYKVIREEDAKSSMFTGESDPEEPSFSCDVEQGVLKEGDADAGDGDGSESLKSLSHHSDSDSSSCLVASQRPRRRSTMASVESMEHVCPICLGSYEQGNMLFVSKECSHIFHSECILEWLTQLEECPICRVKMVTEDEMVEAALELIRRTTTTG